MPMNCSKPLRRIAISLPVNFYFHWVALLRVQQRAQAMPAM